jgi:elongation factor G
MKQVLGGTSEPDQPTGEVAIGMVVPEESAGALIGEFSSRRGRITGVDVQSGLFVIRGSLPASEYAALQEVIASATEQRGKVERERPSSD